MKNCKILFQGDSITDGNRGRSDDPNHILGHGYAYIAACEMGFKYPEKHYEFINRGISGNTAPDLYARWQEDALNLVPDVISILVGINDSAKELDSTEGMLVKRYEKTLRLIIEQTKKVLPETAFILMEPFMLDSGTMDSKRYRGHLDGIIPKQKAVKLLAEEYGAVFVPLQKRLNDACRLRSADYWVWDCVHPTYNGHGLIADAWLNDTKALFGI